MEAIANLPDNLGVHIEASSPTLRAGTALLLLVGAAFVAKPFLSLIRVLLSLFVLPGQSVCGLTNRVHYPGRHVLTIAPALKVRTPRLMGTHHWCL